MQFKELFANETSRANTDYVKDIIYQKPELFEELFELVLKNEEPHSRRAIWVFDSCDEEFPGIAKHFLPQLIDKFDTFGHDGLKRHSLRILSRHEIPEESEVKVLNFCFQMLTLFEAAAIKVHAMQILYNLSQKEPELKPELVSAIELAIQEGTAGVKNRGHRMLKKLRKEIDQKRPGE